MASNQVANQEAVLEGPRGADAEVFDFDDFDDSVSFTSVQAFREEPISNEAIELALNRLTKGLAAGGYCVTKEGRIDNARYMTMVKEDDGSLSMIRTGFGDFHPQSYQPAFDITGLGLLRGLGPHFVLPPRPEFPPLDHDYGLQTREPVQYLLNEAAYVFTNSQVHQIDENLPEAAVIDPGCIPGMRSDPVAAESLEFYSRKELFAALRTRAVHELCDIELFNRLYDEFPRSLEEGVDEANRLSRLASKVFFELDYDTRQEIIETVPDTKLALAFEHIKDFVLMNKGLSVGDPEAVSSFQALLAKYDRESESFIP